MKNKPIIVLLFAVLVLSGCASNGNRVRIEVNGNNNKFGDINQFYQSPNVAAIAAQDNTIRRRGHAQQACTPERPCEPTPVYRRQQWTPQRSPQPRGPATQYQPQPRPYSPPPQRPSGDREKYCVEQGPPPGSVRMVGPDGTVFYRLHH